SSRTSAEASTISVPTYRLLLASPTRSTSWSLSSDIAQADRSTSPCLRLTQQCPPRRSSPCMGWGPTSPARCSWQPAITRRACRARVRSLALRGRAAPGFLRQDQPASAEPRRGPDRQQRAVEDRARPDERRGQDEA